jgi:hypothetical protein
MGVLMGSEEDELDNQYEVRGERAPKIHIPPYYGTIHLLWKTLAKAKS